ncbi:hypothetical protein C4559_04745 [Candidatus Microgenomates bacterium]|nr:MAG: hypothetical protein C4559_04745 [Candidatus Microgenomates bacterium]
MGNKGENGKSAQRLAEIEYLWSSESGKNVVPELVEKAKTTGNTTLIKQGSELLDSIPRIYRNHVLIGGQLQVTDVGVVKMPIYEMPKAGK